MLTTKHEMDTTCCRGGSRYGTDSLSRKLGLLESLETIVLEVWAGLKVFKLGHFEFSEPLVLWLWVCSKMSELWLLESLEILLLMFCRVWLMLYELELWV